MAKLQSSPSSDLGTDQRVETRSQHSAPRILVFISYSREDGREYAKELADWLESRGFDAWLDSDIKAGDHYDSAIEAAIQRSAVVVVIVTDAAIRPESFVRREILYAHVLGKLIVPVQLSKKPGPILLMLRQWLSAEDALGSAIIKRLSGEMPIASSDEQQKRQPTRWTRFILVLTVLACFVWTCSVVDWARLLTKMHEPAPEVLLHIEVLEVRAQNIAQQLLDRNEHDARQEFLSLHHQNVRAHRERNVTLSHELTRQIFDLLAPFRTTPVPIPVSAYKPQMPEDLSGPVDISKGHVPRKPECNEPLEDECSLRKEFDPC